MVCNGPNWCLADCMLRNYYQTWSKTAKTSVVKYFVTDRQKKIVSVSHKIVIQRVLLRQADQRGRTMLCDCPNWCLADCMLRNYYQILSKTAKTGVMKYCVTDRQKKVCLSVTK